MSFSFRDKPRLSERLRGKTSEELINEIREEFDRDNKMFFETHPTWGSSQMTGPFSRTGFPFDDDPPRGRKDIRSHLDDLAQRHPEFADHLRCPPWGGEVSGTFGRKRRGSGSVDDDTQSQASGASGSSAEASKEETEERGRGNLNQHGLRNTVDLGQQQKECEEKGVRNQRSMSAPPDNRAKHPQRYVSRIEINPINPADPTSGGGPATVTSDNQGHGKPPVAPKQPHTQPQPQTGNVRHIPIFVEGRDEPLLPKVGPENVEKVFSSRVPQPEPEQVFPKSHGFGRHTPTQSEPEQVFPQTHGFGRSSPFTSPHPGARTFQQHAEPSSPKQQRQTRSQSQQRSQPQSQPETQPKPQAAPQPPKPPEPTPNDPISRVQAVAKDVAELKVQVEKYSGNSRKDKDYIYLDEMLTRNLLKLDDIDTEGKDNVRQARKEVIKTIQKCISVLEGNVPSQDEECKPVREPMDTGAEENKNGAIDGTEFTVNEVPEEPPTEVQPKVQTAAEPNSTLSAEVSGDSKPTEESQMDVIEEKPSEAGTVAEQAAMEVELPVQPDSAVNAEVKVDNEGNKVPDDSKAPEVQSS